MQKGEKSSSQKRKSSKRQMPRSLPLLPFFPLQGFSHELFQECSWLASCCYSSPAVSYYLQNKCVEIKKGGGKWYVDCSSCCQCTHTGLSVLVLIFGLCSVHSYCQCKVRIWEALLFLACSSVVTGLKPAAVIESEGRDMRRLLLYSHMKAFC